MHGKTGMWSFDSGSPMVYHYFYRVPQYLGAFPDIEKVKKMIPKKFRVGGCLQRF